MTTQNWVRTLGFLLTVATCLLGGFWFAFNRNAIGEFIEQTGGVWPLLAALGAIVGAVLVVFWPRRWSTRLRSIFTLIVLLVALFFGGEPIRAAFAQAPWLVLGILVAIVVWTWVLFGMTVLARFPIPGWVRRAARGLTTAPARP